MYPISNSTFPLSPNPISFSDYTESELLALQLGFVEAQDEKAYRGRYFIKNGKKWIHNIGKLRAVLSEIYGRYIDDEELSASAPEGFGYDVETYYAYNTTHSIINHPDFKSILESVRVRSH